MYMNAGNIRKITIFNHQFLSAQYAVLPAKDAQVHIVTIVINALLEKKKIRLVYLKTLNIAKTLAPVTLMRKLISVNVSTVN